MEFQINLEDDQIVYALIIEHGIEAVTMDAELAEVRAKGAQRLSASSRRSRGDR